MSDNSELLKQLELARRDLLDLSSQNRLLDTPREQERGLSLEVKDELAQQVFQLLVTDAQSMRFEQGELVADDDEDEKPVARKKTRRVSDEARDAAEEANASEAAEVEETPEEEPAKAPLKKTKRVTRKKAATSKTKKAASDEAEATDSGEETGRQGSLFVSSLSPRRETAADEPAEAGERGDAKNRGANAAPLAGGDRHADAVLHTELDPEELDRRLLGLVTDASATFEEQGVNILYLVLGFLKWFDPEAPSKPLYAPLLLVPVKLQRQRVGNRFELVHTTDDIETNLTLKTRLKVDFRIDLPEVPELDDLNPQAYFQQVAQAVSGMSGWEVLANDIVLWFFSFTKLLMYKDLDPANWPESHRLEDRPLLRGLLHTGFPPAPPLISEDQRIDGLLDPASTMHVIDCDSSQSLVIEEACRGRSLVIQGPPGTGKSQTITNLIASAVKSGKRILFVAEKMAALEVVKRRLDKIGLGDMCLELHSDKASKKAVLEEVERTLKLGHPKPPAALASTVEALRQSRDYLNNHVDELHAVVGSSGRTAYQVLSELIELRALNTAMPDFQFAGVETRKEDDTKKQVELVNDYVALLNEMGPPQQHNWRGCELGSLLPLDMQRLVATVPELEQKLDTVQQAALVLSQRLGDDQPQTVAEVNRLIRTVRTLLGAPVADMAALMHPSWTDHRPAVASLGEAARAVVSAREKLKGLVTDAAWDVDVSTARHAYAAKGESWFRIFSGAYRAARTTLLSLLTGPQPATFVERLAILTHLDDARKGKKTLSEAGDLGTKVFGKYWIGPQTDWQQLGQLEAWDASAAKSGISPKYRALLAKLDDKPALTQQADALEKQLLDFVQSFQGQMKSLLLDPVASFGTAPTAALSGLPTTQQTTAATTGIPTGTPTVATAATDGEKLARGLSLIGGAPMLPIAALKQRINAFQSQSEGLQQWQKYQRMRVDLKKIGDGSFLARIDSGKITPANALTAYRFAFNEALYKVLMKSHPDWATFEGNKYEQLIALFSDWDLKRMGLARAEVAECHFGAAASPLNRGANAAPLALNLPDQIGVLQHEMQKKRRHLPLRQLLSQAGQALQAVKPVFMMSPLSVSQFMEPGKIEFDLLLIDEASQVRPVEALGAAARCTQMVCVGDDKQMPPTTFFGSVLGDVQVDDDEPAMQAGDVESILGLCLARNMPQRMLRWHYRSRHQSLIAVSNREFYENQLYVIPSPQAGGELGLKLRFVENGRYLNRVNPIEAQVVAAAVMEHARKHPDWTLGVAAFSVTQRDAILKEVEKLRRDSDDTESFFDSSAPDPFFVKNLENVQGDERDVIFVSVGYGPDEDGKISLNFGPVSAQGGERRLNVLMTRAKRRCEIFTSMRATDLDLTRATGRGPAVFRAFLEYAERGDHTRPTSGTDQRDRVPDVIKSQLEAKGYQVKTNVGVAGVFIDLAVVDPADPERFLLGIECDGLAYKSSRSARDRDRLRDQVLSGMGWKLHHVWCIEYFQRPAEQLAEIVAAIESAKKSKAPATTSPQLPDTPIPRNEGGEDLLSNILKNNPASTSNTGSNTQIGNTGITTGDVFKVGAAVLGAVLEANKGRDGGSESLK